MPASKKMLKNKEQKANREAGIGDAQGRKPSQVKKAEVSASCTKCMTAIRMTKTNTEAKMHVESKHTGVLFSECFPGQYDPTVAVAAPPQTSEESKLDIDRIKAEARDRIGVAEGTVITGANDEKKKKKGKEDLSHLFAAAELGGSGRKKK